MSYIIRFTEEARQDMKKLDGSVKKQVVAAILKVSKNPLPKNEGGLGNPLGNKHDNNLTGLCKIKILNPSIRIVYQLVRVDKVMNIIVIAARSDDEVYKIAAERTK
ncbi:MAG: mRNA interferase RelE [Firmicutes bacterium ADurb.Bin193]|nr:MAG: mRNA interferase RelE [Firmicutes bacterium ADurb.Bin193]